MFKRSRVAWSGAVLFAVAVAGAADAQSIGQLIIRRTVVRVPPPALVPIPRAEPEVRWKERRADKCQPLSSIAAALGSDDDHMDLLMRDGTRLRATFDKPCRAADFYSGFYVRPSPDGKLCADRDVVRARSGMSCRIDRFRTLTARR